MANNEFNIDDYLPKATTQDNSQPAQTTAFNIDDYLGIQANDVTGLGEKQAVDFATQLANFPNASPVQQYIAFEQYGNQYKDYLTGKGYSGDQIAQMMAEFSKADPRNQTSEYEYYIGDRGKEVMVGSGNLTGDALAVVPESIPVIGSLADQAEKYVKDTTKAWKNAKSARSQIQTYLGNKAEIEARANGASEFSALMANLKENPMQIVSLITEQAPQLLLGGMGKSALTGVNVAGGAGRVRSDIEEAYETTAKENPSQLLQLPEIKDRMAKGMSFEEAVNDAKTDITDNWKSIAAGAVIGGTEAFTPLGKLGQGVNRGVLKTLGKEVGQEAFQEGAEQLNSNLAVGSIDGKTQAFDNVIRNSTLGGITGLGTGIPTAIEAGLNKNKPIQTQAQTLLNSDEQTIQQENIQPEQPNTETNQPQQAVENPQQNANPLDEFALSQALASVDEESHAEFQQRLGRDLANGKAESRKSGKYGKFVQDYLALNSVPEVVRQQQQAEQNPIPQSIENQAPLANIKLPKVSYGSIGDIELGSQGSRKFSYQLIEADELNVNLKPNQYQNRDRTSADSQAQIMEYAANLNPAYLGASVDVTQGAPLVDISYGVFAGNGRLAAIKQAYAKHSEKATAYKNYLAQNAEQFGLMSEQVKSMKQPVLIRHVFGPIDIPKAVEESNFNTGLDKGVLGNARENANYISDDLLDFVQFNEDGSLNLSESNTPFIQGLVANVPVEHRPRFFAEKKLGNQTVYTLTAQGRELVENALLTKAYSDGSTYADNLLTDLITGTGEGNKRVKAALISTAGKIIQTKGTDYDISPELIQAYDLMVKGKKAGLNAEQAAAQGDMLNQPSNFVQDLVKRFYSPKSIAEVREPLNDYLGKVVNSGLNNTAQDSMFGDDFTPSKQELLNQSGMRASRSPIKSVEANIKRGREAMNIAITERRTVHRAMFNHELGGWVDFEWGDDGLTKPFNKKGEPVGKGIAHIIEARQRKDGMSNQDVVRMLTNNVVETIAKGEIVHQKRNDKFKEDRITIDFDKYRVALLKRDGGNAWIITGFEKFADGERSVGNDTTTPTHPETTLTRQGVGASENPTDEQVGSNDPNLPTHSLPTRQRQGMGAVGTDNVQQFTQQRNNQIVQDQATLSRILGEKTASHIQVVDSNTQIPTGQNVKKLAANGVEGWFDVSSQKLYIISDNITANEVLSRDERLAWVAFHELSHAGVRIKFGPILTNVLASAGKNVVVKVLARKIQAEYGYTQEVATEEAMAEIYAAFETGNWAELESRYKVKIHQSYKQGKDSVGDFLTKVANILRRLIGGIVGKDLTQTMTTSQVFDTLRGIQQGVNDIANTEQNQTASGDARYSLNERSDSAFAKAVDEVVNGNVSRGYIAMGTTPDVLKMLGLPDTKIRIQGKTIEKVMGEYLGIEQGKHSHLHNLTPETLKRLPQNINNPVAVFNSSTKENGYVVLTELTETDSRTGTKKPVIAALHLKPAKGGVEIIDIASVYGRSQGQLQTAFDEELLYLNKEKAQRLNTERLQLSWDFTSDVELSARNVKTEADLSQYQAENSVRYSFAGRNAKTANHSLLEQAERDLASGKDPETIRQETGWFKGVDGKWRFEIDDSQISFKQNFDETDNALSVLQKSGNSNQPVATVGDILNAPELFAAYPDIAKINVVNSNDDYTAGGYSSDDFISLDSNLPVNKIKSTLLHELQHAIQNREQFAYGGSIDPRFIYVLQQELYENVEDSRLALQRLNGKYSVYTAFISKGKEAELKRKEFVIYRSVAKLRDYAYAENITRYRKHILDNVNLVHGLLLDIKNGKLSVTDEVRKTLSSIDGKTWNLPNQRSDDFPHALRVLALDTAEAFDSVIRNESRAEFDNDKRAFNTISRALDKAYDAVYDDAENARNVIRNAERQVRKAEALESKYGHHNASPYQIYTAMAGEVEARNVETRMNMTAEERLNRSPESTEDVRRDEQIVRYADGSIANSLNENPNSDFARAVDGVANGNRTAQPIIDVGTTPDVLKMLGLPDVNVVISGAVLHKVMHGKHNVTPETLKQLPKQINNPVAVMKSETQANSYVVLTELTERENGKDKPVIAALHLKRSSQGLELINIASVYGRSNAQIQRGLENDLLYWNKEKGAKFLDNLTLQLRSPLSSNSSIGGNIKTEADLSQYQAENSTRYSRKPLELSKSAYDQAKENGETELTFQQWKQVRSPEFKRWFGDWENDPENASKVINPRTGEPLVVYHGSNAAFSVFSQTGKTDAGWYGRGYYFTQEPLAAEMYAEYAVSERGGESNQYAVYLNLKNPKYLNLADRDYGKIATGTNIDTANETTAKNQAEGYDGVIVFENTRGNEVLIAEELVAFDSNQIKSATDNNGEFSSENEDIRYSRKQSAMETANAKQVNQHPNVFERVKNGGFAQFKKEVEKARAFIDTKVHDRLRPVMDWIDGIDVKGLSPYEKSQLKDSIYAAEGIKADIIVQAELKYLNPIRDDIAAIAKKYFNGDGETALKKAGFWISTRWAIEKNAQMLKADYDAMVEAEQEYNDAVANGEPMNVQDRLERAFIKAENRYYNRKADVESRDFSDDRKYKVGTAGGWSTPLAKAIMAKMESQIPRAELEALAEKVYDLNAWKLEQDLESGRFTAEEVKRFKQDRHYVPLTGDPSMELDDMLRMPSNRNPNVAKDKGMEGRKLSEADDAITTIWESAAKTATYNGWQPMKAHFAKLYDQAYQEAISNGLSQKAAADEATKKTGIAKQKMQGLTRTSDNVLIYKENGNYYELSLPEKAMEQIKKQNSDNTPTPLRPVQAATGWLARGVTQFKLHFAMVNMVRDLWEKSEFVRTKEIFDKNGNPLSEEVKNQIGREIWKQAMGAIAGQNTDVWKAAKRYAMKQGLRNNVPAELELKTLLKNGGVSTHSTLLERKETDLIKTINKRNSSLAKGIEKAIRAVEIYNGIFDIVSSISANRALLKYGVDPKHASAVTLDLTNFRKQGDWMPFIKSFYMFAQPAAIGGANLIKMMGTKTGRVRLLKGALFFGALSFILRSIADEDEDGNAFAKEGDKDRFIPISIGEYNFKLPVGYGAPQLMWNMGYNITEAIMGDKTWGDAAASTMLHAFKAVTPVSPSEVPVSEYPGTKLLMTLTPTIAQPIVQNIVNRNAFGSQLANSYINDKSLKSEQGKMSTAPEWTEAALWLNDTFGMDFAPEHVKNFIQGYANIVPLMNETLTILVENPNKARLGKPESIPFINAVVGPKNPYATQSQFYRFRDEANDTVKNFNSRKERGTLPESWKTDPEIRWQRNWFAKVEEMEKLQRKVKSNLTRLHNEGKLSTEVYQERLNNLAKDTEAKQRKLVGMWRFHNGLNTTATRD